MADLIDYPRGVPEKIQEILINHPRRDEIVRLAKALAYDRNSQVETSDILIATLLIDSGDSQSGKKRSGTSFLYALGGALIGAAISTWLGLYGSGIAMSGLFLYLLFLIGLLGVVLCLEAKQRE